MSTTILLELVKVECCNCGCVYGLTETMERRMRDSHALFYCPNGHSQYFPGETEAEKLKRQVAQLQTSIEHKDANISSLREQRSALERSRAALKGVHTRTCNRVKNGVCPCCNRTFANLAAHMHTKHPDFKAAE